MQCAAVLGEAIRDQIERLKWSLWHGQVDKALGKIDDLETSIEPLNETYARFTHVVKALSELRTYIVNNRHLIPNKYPPAKPEVLRLLAPQRGLTAIAKSKPKTEKTTNGRLPELSNFGSPPAEPGVYPD